MRRARKWLMGVGLIIASFLSHGAERYRAPKEMGLSEKPRFAPVMRREQWSDDERGGRIQFRPPLEPRFSLSEEEEARPVLDLRRLPSSEGLGERPSGGWDNGNSRLMIGNEWEIIWQEKEETVGPQRWKYEK